MAVANTEEYSSVRARIVQIESEGIPQTLEGLIRYLRPIMGVCKMEQLWESLDFVDNEMTEEPLTVYDYWKDIYLQYVENPSISVVLQNKTDSMQASIKIDEINSLQKEVNPRLSRVQFRIIKSFLEDAEYEHNSLDIKLEILNDTKTCLDEVQTLIEKVKSSFIEEDWVSLKTDLDSKDLSEVITRLEKINVEKGL